MGLAQNIAKLREAEVEKMREKVKHMQVKTKRREKITNFFPKGRFSGFTAFIKKNILFPAEVNPPLPLQTCQQKGVFSPLG